MKQQWTDAPVLLMSGHMERAEMRLAFDLGVYDVMDKPLIGTGVSSESPPGWRCIT